MVERFFFLQRNDISRTVTDLISLISGPPSSGKTSLLFQYAYNSASMEMGPTSSSSSSSNGNGGGEVVFICNRRRLESSPPFLSQGIDPSSDVFRRIHMKYMDDDEGIKKYFAAFHLFDKFPQTVIIDDFSDLFNDRNCQEKYNSPRGRDLAMIRTLALCRNALDHANSVGGKCRLLLSDTHPGDSPRLLFIYKRWVSSIYTIKGDGLGSFTMKNLSSTSSSRDRRRVAKYSVALQYLILEALLDELLSVACGLASGYISTSQASPLTISQASAGNTLQNHNSFSEDDAKIGLRGHGAVINCRDFIRFGNCFDQYTFSGFQVGDELVKQREEALRFAAARILDGFRAVCVSLKQNGL